jgi:pyrimidine-nucleoside phosphorylase
MRMLDIIEKKRDRNALTDSEIAFFVKGVSDGAIPSYQISALLMACYLNGMNDAETASLTYHMAHTGGNIDLSFAGGAVVDKHSSGGVGDKTTLVVAPIAAACGLKIAKMSGRGLGFSGGTIDKLESIPGFRVSLTREEFIRCIRSDGLSIISQTSEVAPGICIYHRGDRIR